MTDEELFNLKTLKARFHNRFPTLAWRNQHTGALLYRSSQPCLGFFTGANVADIKFYEKIKAVANFGTKFVNFEEILIF